MAKRIVKWVIENGIMKISKALEDPKAVAEIEAEFDIRKIYPDFDKMNDVQQNGVLFGIKQKLMDTGASDVGDPNSKIASAKEQWTLLCDGKWRGERANATGAAEDKAALKRMKDAANSEVVTMQSLLAKQFLRPAEFTAEDAVKLAEFAKAAAKAAQAATKAA